MMRAAQDRTRYQVFRARSKLVPGPGRWSEVQTAVRSSGVVIRHELPQQPSEVTIAQHDDMIEAVTAEGADHAFGNAVGLRCAHRGQHGLDADAGRLGDEVPPIARVAVADPEAWRPIPSGGGDHLPPDPGCPGISRHVPMLDSAPFVADDHVAGERAKGPRLHGEEIRGPDVGSVQAEEHAPRGRGWALQRLPPVAPHRRGAAGKAAGLQGADNAHGTDRGSRVAVRIPV